MGCISLAQAKDKYQVPGAPQGTVFWLEYVMCLG